MIGLGVAGVISYGVMSQLGQFKSSAVRTDRKIEMETFLDNVTKALVRKDVCDTNFRGMDVSSANPTVLYGNTDKTKVLIQEGQSYLTNVINVNELSVIPIAGSSSSFNLTITAIKNKEKKLII